MAADPKVSYGARVERKAIIAHLRRKFDVFIKNGLTREAAIAQQTIDYILGRDEEYNKRPGGLGRK
jgi:hypothetical protein